MVLMLAVEFKTKLGFNPFDPIKRKGQSVLTIFPSEGKLLQHYVLGYKIDLYLLKHKLAMEIDVKGHKDRNQ